MRHLFDTLSPRDKEFWLKCDKETLIEHWLESLNNGEVLLDRIEKAIEYLEKSSNDSELIKILKGWK